jgi:AbrB family looped-hinge helix DNA binding protein
VPSEQGPLKSASAAQMEGPGPRTGFPLDRRDNTAYLTFVLPWCRAMAEVHTTTVSTKGQVILPKAIRQRWEWTPGTRLIVEETPEGVLLKQAPAFAATRPEDVFGLLAFKGTPRSLEEMDAGVLAEARHHDRN